jgi:hypothetical protein
MNFFKNIFNFVVVVLNLFVVLLISGSFNKTKQSYLSSFVAIFITLQYKIGFIEGSVLKYDENLEKVIADDSVDIIQKHI